MLISLEKKYLEDESLFRNLLQIKILTNFVKNNFKSWIWGCVEDSSLSQYCFLSSLLVFSREMGDLLDWHIYTQPANEKL